MTEPKFIVDRAKQAAGEYCNKKSPTCFCKVGWPYEEQCPQCRDTWPDGVFRDSYCICPLKEITP
jgi:hypothetical protein